EGGRGQQDVVARRAGGWPRAEGRGVARVETHEVEAVAWPVARALGGDAGLRPPQLRDERRRMAYPPGQSVESERRAQVAHRERVDVGDGVGEIGRASCRERGE